MKAIMLFIVNFFIAGAVMAQEYDENSIKDFKNLLSVSKDSITFKISNQGQLNNFLSMRNGALELRGHFVGSSGDSLKNVSFSIEADVSSPVVQIMMEHCFKVFKVNSLMKNRSYMQYIPKNGNFSIKLNNKDLATAKIYLKATDDFSCN